MIPFLKSYYRAFRILKKWANIILRVDITSSRYIRSQWHKFCVYRESVVGSVIQATGTVDFEDGLRTGVLQEDCWCPYSGCTTLESDMARPWRLASTQVQFSPRKPVQNRLTKFLRPCLVLHGVDHEWFHQWAIELADLEMLIDLASNLEPVLTQMFCVSYNDNKFCDHLRLAKVL